MARVKGLVVLWVAVLLFTTNMAFASFLSVKTPQSAPQWYQENSDGSYKIRLWIDVEHEGVKYHYVLMKWLPDKEYGVPYMGIEITAAGDYALQPLDINVNKNELDDGIYIYLGEYNAEIGDDFKDGNNVVPMDVTNILHIWRSKDKLNVEQIPYAIPKVNISPVVMLRYNPSNGKMEPYTELSIIPEHRVFYYGASPNCTINYKITYSGASKPIEKEVQYTQIAQETFLINGVPDEVNVESTVSCGVFKKTVTQSFDINQYQSEDLDIRTLGRAEKCPNIVWELPDGNYLLAADATVVTTSRAKSCELNIVELNNDGKVILSKIDEIPASNHFGEDIILINGDKAPNKIVSEVNCGGLMKSYTIGSDSISVERPASVIGSHTGKQIVIDSGWCADFDYNAVVETNTGRTLSYTGHLKWNSSQMQAKIEPELQEGEYIKDVNLYMILAKTPILAQRIGLPESSATAQPIRASKVVCNDKMPGSTATCTVDEKNVVHVKITFDPPIMLKNSCSQISINVKKAGPHEYNVTVERKKITNKDIMCADVVRYVKEESTAFKADSLPVHVTITMSTSEGESANASCLRAEAIAAEITQLENQCNEECSDTKIKKINSLKDVLRTEYAHCNITVPPLPPGIREKIKNIQEIRGNGKQTQIPVENHTPPTTVHKAKSKKVAVNNVMGNTKQTAPKQSESTISRITKLVAAPIRETVQLFKTLLHAIFGGSSTVRAK